MKPVLIIKTGDTLPDVSARRGDFDQWIRDGLALSEIPVDTVCVFRDEPLPSPKSVSAVVVTGSSAMVSERDGWSERTAAWLADAVASGTWILGICFGHQLLAHSLGGRVGPNPRGRQIGTIALQLHAEGDALLGGLPEEIVVQASHLEVVLEFPKTAIGLGKNAMDANAAFRVGERAWGVQFHPEFDADIMRGYIRGRGERIAEEGGDPVALEAACRDSPHGGAVLARFGELVRRAEPS